MNKWFKIFFLFIAVILLSIGVSFASFKFFSEEEGANSSYLIKGNAFNQKQTNHISQNQEESYPDFTKAVDNTVNGVVHIRSIAKSMSMQRRKPVNPFEFFFGLPDDKLQHPDTPESKKQGMVIGSGSGVIISDDGYIITNNHVIDKASEIEVTLNDNRKYIASVIGTDPLTDIALLKIDGEDKFSYVPFGDSDKLKIGEWVIAVGNPFNLTSTVTKGIVSAKARGNIGGGRNTIQSFIQTDAAINPGNSGGALVNTNGELVGINTAIYSQTGNFMGYGFAVPISIAGKVAADLKEFGTVQRAILGIQIMNLGDLREFADMKEKLKDIDITGGVYIHSFSDNSPAKKAGLQPGDIIISIDNVKTPNSNILQEQVSRYRPGETIDIIINRDNEDQKFKIVLTNAEGTTSIVKKEDPLSIAGISFKELSPETKKKLGLNYGVEIESVDKAGAFAKKNITKGAIILEINRIAIRNVEQTVGIINAIINSNANNSAENEKVFLVKLLMPNGQKRFEAIELQ